MFSVFLLLHHDVQTINIEMLIVRIDFFQNSIALGRFPISVRFQKIDKNLFYNLVILLFDSVHYHQQSFGKDSF